MSGRVQKGGNKKGGYVAEREKGMNDAREFMNESLQSPLAVWFKLASAQRPETAIWTRAPHRWAESVQEVSESEVSV
jgi:hypothetical protein